MTRSRVPPILQVNGRRFWRELIAKYEFRPDELRILQDAAAEIDLIDDLETHLRGAPRLVMGSMKQLVINPIIPELRQHRATLASLLGKLNLPDDAGETRSSASGSTRSTQARRAAMARWGKDV